MAPWTSKGALSRIYAELGVRSRVELAGLMGAAFQPPEDRRP